MVQQPMDLEQWDLLVNRVDQWVHNIELYVAFIPSIWEHITGRPETGEYWHGPQP